MTHAHHPNPVSHIRPRVMFSSAAQGFLGQLPPSLCAHADALLTCFEQYLGAPAPLLAYTKFTGEAWLRSLPEAEEPEGRVLLQNFRAFLREEGWLDAARPVNLPD